MIGNIAFIIIPTKNNFHEITIEFINKLNDLTGTKTFSFLYEIFLLTETNKNILNCNNYSNDIINGFELIQNHINNCPISIIINSDIFFNVDYFTIIEKMFIDISNMLIDSNKLLATFNDDALIFVNNDKLSMGNLLDIFKIINTNNLNLFDFIQDNILYLSKTTFYNNYITSQKYRHKKFKTFDIKNITHGDYLDLIYKLDHKFYKNYTTHLRYRESIILLNNLILYKLCDLHSKYKCISHKEYIDKSLIKLKYMKLLTKISLLQNQKL